MYVVTRDDLYLIPTAEVPVTNLHRDEILEADDLVEGRWAKALRERGVGAGGRVGGEVLVAEERAGHTEEVRSSRFE